MRALALVVAAFVAMEPVTYLLHRFVMHGPGWTWHASHHRRRPAGRRFEANDRFPLLIGATSALAMLAGYQVDGLGPLVPLAAGAGAYGLVYALVHDVYVHRRLRWPGPAVPALERLAAAHRRHHQSGGEPYGLLLPWAPSRRRSARPLPSGS